MPEYARELEARRSGVYHATPEELAAIDAALRTVPIPPCEDTTGGSRLDS